MPKLENEYIHAYAKYVITRKELIDKFGFDPCDAFIVDRIDYGRGGVSFTLKEGTAAKYKPKPAPPVVPDLPVKRVGWLKKYREGSK